VKFEWLHSRSDLEMGYLYNDRGHLKLQASKVLDMLYALRQSGNSNQRTILMTYSDIAVSALKYAGRRKGATAVVRRQSNAARHCIPSRSVRSITALYHTAVYT
jgi:hypothetical protein